METDVVVAAGLSGLAASIAAAEGGAKVITLEKGTTTGGAANMGMGPLGVGSRLQKSQMIALSPGEAVGVVATDKNGEDIEIRAKKVIIATGGFGENPQMIKEETGYEFGETIFNFAVPGMRGDGIKMCWEAGAGKEQPMHRLSGCLRRGRDPGQKEIRPRDRSG